MKLRIHPKFIHEGIEYTMFSSDYSASIIFPTLIPASFKCAASQSLGECFAYPASTLDWIFHGKFDLYNLISFTDQVLKYQLLYGWNFTAYKRKAAIEAVRLLSQPFGRFNFIYLVHDDYFLGNVKTEKEDDSSYTEGYRQGCTGLKWL